MSTTFTYDQVRKPEHSTFGDSLERYERDADAFTAGSQNALDRLLSALARANALNQYVEDLAADILDDTHHGDLT